MSTEKKACTLKDVAALAEVHLSVVSHVLNKGGGNTRVSPRTRAAILRAAEELHYTPNETARTLRRGTSETVGLICGDFRNPFFAELAAALEASLDREGFILSISHVAGEATARRRNVLERMRNQGLRSVLVWSEAYDRSLDKPDKDSRRIYIGFSTEKARGIWLDLEQALRLTVKELSLRGHTRLGYYSPDSPHESPSVKVRRELFRQCCREAGLSDPQQVRYPGESWDLTRAAEIGWNVLKESPEVEAWVGFNDVASIGLLLAAGHAGRSDRPCVFCPDGTRLARQWPGRPPTLDLGISRMAERVAVAVREGLPEEPVVMQAHTIQPNGRR